MTKLDIRSQMEILDESDIEDELDNYDYTYKWYVDYKYDIWQDWVNARNLPTNYISGHSSKFPAYRTYGLVARREYGYYPTYSAYHSKLQFNNERG